MPSQFTSVPSIIYTEMPVGGAGLVGISGTTPGLSAVIVGIPGKDNQDLQASIVGKSTSYSNLESYIIGDSVASGYSTSTSGIAGQSIYTDITTGGFGVLGKVISPDLHSVVIGQERVLSGTEDLSAIIYSLEKDQKNLSAYWNSANSGTLDLSATLSGFFETPLRGYITPSISGEKEIYAHIEPVPGFILAADWLGMSLVDISGTITPIPGEDLSATLSGVPRSDLLSTLFGFSKDDIKSSYSGFLINDLQSAISGIGKDHTLLYGDIKGVLGKEFEQELDGYVLGTTLGQGNLSGSLLGVSKEDLYAELTGRPSGVNLYSSITGMLPDGSIVASIIPTGDVLDLPSYVIGTENLNTNLQSIIDGYGKDDLRAEINSNIQNTIVATISSTSSLYDNLVSSITPTYIDNLQGRYDISIGEGLEANINPIDGSDLFASITPKVFYIDSTIPINTFPFEDLKAVINGELCRNQGSSFNDLGVFISGTNHGDLSASIIAVAGQYSIAVDAMSLNIKNKVTSEDWMFLIADQPAISQNLLPIIITNSPLGDLQAVIEGISESSDLKANIDPVYISSIYGAGTPLGEWVNTSTWEHRIIRIYFRGRADNFYYSSSGHVTYPDSTDDYLEIVVETYEKIEEANRGLLTIKTGVKKSVVDNLSSFKNIDEAIKYAILRSNSELSGELSAMIYSVGETEYLEASVSGINDNLLSDLKASINPAANLPDLLAEVSSTGDIGDLQAGVSSHNPQLTSTPFYDTVGNRYLPTLRVLTNGEYEVVLTLIDPTDIIDVTSPDLYIQISGIGNTNIGASITGTT